MEMPFRRGPTTRILRGRKLTMVINMYEPLANWEVEVIVTIVSKLLYNPSLGDLPPTYSDEIIHLRLTTYSYSLLRTSRTSQYHKILLNRDFLTPWVQTQTLLQPVG